MIQVYKKNELFIIENTVTDIIYPNLTREEALVLLEKFDRNETEHRCDFAIKEDDISFEYVSLDDKDKTIAEQRKQIADLEAKLAESEYKNEQLVDALNGEVFINYKLPMENAQLKQQLADKNRKIADLQSQLQQANEIINNPDTLIFQQQQLIDNLKSQLAEKDLKIIELETKLNLKDKGTNV